MGKRTRPFRAPRWLRELSGFSLTKPTQLLEKSNQWSDDADFLFRKQRRAAAVYLGGFVIECLLKAALFPRRMEPRVARLLYGSHDLQKLLGACGGLERELALPLHHSAWTGFQFLQSWSVRIRYNPKKPSTADARDYQRRLKEVRRWLIGRI